MKLNFLLFAVAAVVKGLSIPRQQPLISQAEIAGQVETMFRSLSICHQQCVSNQLVLHMGMSHLTAGVLTFNDLLFACTEFSILQFALESCGTQMCELDGNLNVNPWQQACAVVVAADIRDIDIQVQQPNPALFDEWDPYYTNTLTDFDWINIREAIKSIVQIKQYGPVFLRLSWHDAQTGNINFGTGGPHATMMVQNPEDTGNKGLQRAIDALEPIYSQYEGRISRADLWSFSGAVAVRVMGGPIARWRPGRNDLGNIYDAGLSEANRLLDPLDSWEAIRQKFASMGLNPTDAAALVFGGHGVGRCHRQYSGYHGPWTGQEHTFSHFYATLLDPNSPSVNEPLPAISPDAFQTDSTNPVNGGFKLVLPSDTAIITAILDLAHSPAAGAPGPGADKVFLRFGSNSDKSRASRDLFFAYFADAYSRLLEVTLDPEFLGDFVSPDPADPFGLFPAGESPFIH
ncbi:hypothetical protein HDU98_006933 [Podochytrium sp. JEL0797]|nr:hypothetical protein HDU98_006933 [Podochytrium sp. JEL0797]